MENKTVEVSFHGTWATVPAIDFNGITIAITGKWLKLAAIHDEDLQQLELTEPELCVKTLKEGRSRGQRADIFTFTQKLGCTTPRFSYRMERESIAAIRTTNFKQWWEKLPQESRKNVRRAEKRGVAAVVKKLDDELVRGIVELNNDSPMRQGKPFVHYGKPFDEVKKDQVPYADRSDYVCAYVGEELIGYIKIVYGGDVGSIVQILPKASHHDKRPANAMIAKAVELCESKGLSYLTYGLFNYGNRKESPVRQFKVRNGFEEILMPRFYVPLTNWGRLCMTLGIHRGLLGILPESVISLAADARTKWYNLRYSTKPV